MKKIFFFMLFILQFLVVAASDISDRLTYDDIVRKFLFQHAEYCSEECKEIIYRALRGESHLTKKDPLKYDDPIMYTRLFGHPPIISQNDEELPAKMQEDIKHLHDEFVRHSVVLQKNCQLKRPRIVLRFPDLRHEL